MSAISADRGRSVLSSDFVILASMSTTFFPWTFSSSLSLPYLSFFPLSLVDDGTQGYSRPIAGTKRG